MKPDEFKSGIPGMGGRMLGNHRDARMTPRGALMFYGFIAMLFITGIVLVVLSK